MLGLITEPCLSVRHWREAHNRHFEPVFYRLSLSAEFCQAAPLWQLSMAQRLSTPEQNPNDWQILQTLANPVRSDSNREAAVLHSSYTACTQPLCHFRWQALSEDGDQSYTLSTWLCIPGAQESCAGDKWLTPSCFLPWGKVLSYIAPDLWLSAAAQTHNTAWWACRQVPSPSTD